jgi:molybdopterin molybdotransferase
MVSVAEADQIIQSITCTLPVLTIPTEETGNHILAEPVYADRDLPPYDRVTMDGIAINSHAIQPDASFLIEGTQAAGMPRKTLTSTNHCIKVMTGAVLPEGADTVVPVELLVTEDNQVRITQPTITAGANIHRQGTDAQAGACLLHPGTRLTPAEVAILASVGKRYTTVYTFPKTAVISTGDELVGIDEIPEPHQIRQSNTHALQAAMRTMGWMSDRFHFRDEKLKIQQGITKILDEYDILIVSGGVSKGEFDFIPDVLTAAGIRKHFHQVAQRPGKPLWFGSGDRNKKIVFALPGNPVSTFLNFYRYIKPWMERQTSAFRQFPSAILATDFTFTPALTYFLQVILRNEDGLLKAYPAPGGGSGDFVNLRQADGFLELPSERSQFRAGESFPLIVFR